MFKYILIYPGARKRLETNLLHVSGVSTEKVLPNPTVVDGCKPGARPADAQNAEGPAPTIKLTAFRNTRVGKVQNRTKQHRREGASPESQYGS